MSRSTILTTTCPKCGKLAVERKRIPAGKEIIIALQCGHMIVKSALQIEQERKVVLKDGREAFPFQMSPTGRFIDDLGEEHEDTISFVEKADCNALILHEQGLGKTICLGMLLERNWKDLCPALIIVKSGLRMQFFSEIYHITGIVPQIITSTKDKPYLDIFPITIVSVDSLRIIRPDFKIVSDWDVQVAVANGRKSPREGKPLWSDEILKQYKFICVDEIQKLKNGKSSRTKATRIFCKLANNGNKPRFLGMSGTPIDKHSGEFFPALNFVRPELFPQEATYQLNHCKVDPSTGKLAGLRNPTKFKALTKDFIIRFRREQVLSSLPKVFRQFKLVEMEGGELDAYCKVMKDFMDFMEDPRPKMPMDILGFLSKMRHIVGIAKVPAAIDWTEEFLESNERKLVIFTHHQMVAQLLVAKLGDACTELGIAPPLYLKGGMGLEERVGVEEQFRSGPNRILVASTLASCEGLNLQFCSDCLFVERQWNPTTEEQAEGRFPRPGQKADKINAAYLIAAGTMDDFLTELVEIKRKNVANTLDGRELTWDETNLIHELATVLAIKGLAKWKVS